MEICRVHVQHTHSMSMAYPQHIHTTSKILPHHTGAPTPHPHLIQTTSTPHPLHFQNASTPHPHLTHTSPTPHPQLIHPASCCPLSQVCHCCHHAEVVLAGHTCTPPPGAAAVHDFHSHVVERPGLQEPVSTAAAAAAHGCSKDKPEDLGYPPVEPAATKPTGKDKPKPDVLKQLVNNVLKNPFIWGMALTYFFIYIVRQVKQDQHNPRSHCVTQ